MKITFTRNLSLLFAMCLLGVLQLVASQSLYAQKDTTVPTIRVDLTGKPNFTWRSGPVTRNGLACVVGGSKDSNDNCVQFEIYLDKNAGSMEFAIVDGPVPSGSMGYQINCGPQIPVGKPICVEGTGPHILTLCMPGNAKGEFVIKSIAAFNPQDDVSVTAGCSAMLRAPLAFESGSIVWSDVNGGIYNHYLSFPYGDTTAVVTPDANAPAYVDFEVKGTSMETLCSSKVFSDTVRVFFYPPPTITIGPDPAIICPGGSGVVLTGKVTGGDGNWSYVWTDPAGNVVGNQPNYTATAVGTYKLEVRTVSYPNCREFSATVNVVSNLAADAGPDQLVCAQNPVQLAGAVTAATGGVWSGGAGTFSPSNTALNATYMPTAAEIAVGSVKLTLTSTGNGSCSPVSDDVVISFYGLQVELTGTPVICSGTLGTVTANVTGGRGTISYIWSSGETTATITDKQPGTYTVTVSDGQSCLIVKSFTVTEVFGPTGFTASMQPETCSAGNGSVTVSGITDGTAPYMYSADGTSYQNSPVLSGLAAGDYTIYVRDANGCTVAQNVTVTDIAGPSAVTASATSASCENNDGSITVGAVTGGTSAYSYSIDGISFQASTRFTGLASGTYTVTAKDANGCTVTTTATVTKEVLTSFDAAVVSATCGASNASITISGVAGGIAPYTYSKDGVNFQPNTVWADLPAGAYTITVMDAKGCTLSKAVTVGNIAGPTDLTATAKSSTCGASNAAISITNVTGGTGSYIYSLDGANFYTSPTFTGLAAGSYTVYVKDGNGCIYAEALTVTDISGPAFTATPQASTCGASNGVVRISGITGGTAPYTYALNGGGFQTGASFTGLAAGTYRVTVKDANGCVLVKQVEVSDIAGPSNFALTAQPSTCGASNASILVSNIEGGTGTYLYSLDGVNFQASAAFSSLAAGDYTITVKDGNSCTFAKSITVTNVAGPSDLAASATSSTCGASNGILTITGVTGGTSDYTYSIDGTNFQVSAAFAGLPAGQHTLTVKDANGCTFSKAFTITNIAGPTAVSATAQPTSCSNNDGSITVDSVTGGTSNYVYSINGTSFQSSATFTGLASGSYTITAKDANGCIVTTSVTVGQNLPTDFASTSVASTCGASNGSMTVGAVTGGFAPYAYSKDGVNFQSSATLTGFAAGTHTITVQDARGCTFTKSVTILNIAGPSDLTFAATASTCGNSNGQLKVSGVSGGAAPFIYSLNGTNFQDSDTFAGLAEGTYTIYVKDANGCTYSEGAAVSNIAGPSYTLAAKASTCGASNGTITVNSPTGGTAPYVFSLNGSAFQSSATFTGLAAGAYTIRVKDANQCTLTQTIEVTDIAGPSNLNLASTSSTCGSNNGAISISGVTGGTAPYAYSIDGANFQASQTFNAVVAGAYTIIVKDANGCTFSKEIVVENIAGPTGILASATSSTCGASNGILTVTGVTGGTAPYMYSRDGVNFQASSTLTGFAAGSRTIYVRDANGCTFSKAFTITNIAGPTAVSATTQPASCQGNDGSIIIGNVTGGTTPFLYSINGTDFQSGTSFTGLASGVYTLTVKDANGCSISTSVKVNLNVPTAFTSSFVASTCGRADGQLTIGTVTGGTAPYTYSIDGASFQTSATFTALSAGAYNITVKDAKGCVFTDEVGVRNIEGPTFNAVSTATTCGAANGSIKISNTTGGVGPYTYNIDGINFQQSTTFNNLPAGTYTITARDANGCVGIRAVVVEDIAGPDGLVLTALPSTCGAGNASITVSEVDGGTAPYLYSIDGTTFQSAAAFANLLAGTYSITVKDANGCIISKTVEVGDAPGPNGLNLASTSSTCGAANGKVEVIGVTAGTAPYTFSLDGKPFQQGITFGSVPAGEHIVTVKDANGCTFAKNIVVENIAGPTGITASSTASTCGASNGALTVTAASGGTAPYLYSLDGVNFQESLVFGNLPAGSHTLTVKDANGCTVSRAFTITNISGPTAVSATSLPASCNDNDGSILAGTVTGGTAPYLYSINGTDFLSGTSFTGLASGLYTVIAKDTNGCTVTSAVTVGQNVPTDFASTTVASTCGGSNGSITVGNIIGGAAPYQYSIDGTNFQASATFNNLLAVPYRITVKDAKGCTFSKEVVVENIAGPSALATSVKPTTCGAGNGTITVRGVTGGTAPYIYSINGTDFQSSTTFASLLAGDYEVMVKDANGCTYTQSVTLENIPGPSAFTASATASSCGRANGSITVGAVTGGTAPYIYSADGSGFQESATLTGLLAGEHTIMVKDANGCVVSQKVAVEDVPGPSDVELNVFASTCGRKNGYFTVTGVTGGTAPYMFARNGTPFQSYPTFGSLLAGEYTITVRDANGCTFSKQLVITDAPGISDFAGNVTPSTCGSSNGVISVTEVTGGNTPFRYSIDGATFQYEKVFSGLTAGSYNVTVIDRLGCTAVKRFDITNIAGPTAVSATFLPASCNDNDGSIMAGTVTGGTAPYLYSINGTDFLSSASFTGLASGSYTVTAKDANGCTVTTSVSVGQNVPTDFASTTVASTCGGSNGSITVGNITGGTAPYQYSIDGTNFQSSATFTELAAVPYTVTVKDANGCTFSKEVQVEDIAGPSALATTVKASTCGSANASIKISGVTGGTAPYAFSINGTDFQSSTTFGSLPAGDYEVTVRDANGCTFIQAVTLENIPGPTAFAVSPTASNCGRANGSITVGAVTGGTAPYIYSVDGAGFQESATLTGLLAGQHTIAVKDANGCVVSQKVIVEDVAGPSGLELASTASTCGASNGSIAVGDVTGGTAPYQYSIDGVIFRNVLTFENVMAGEHTITVKDANGCTFSAKITVENISGPANLTALVKPTTCGASNGELNITDVAGGTAPYLYSIDGTGFQGAAGFAGLTAGVHHITVKDANGCTYIKAFVVSSIAGPSAIAATARAASCADNDGSITVGNITGGVAPYTYSLNGTDFQSATSFTGLASGEYTITVKDANGCETTETMKVSKDGPASFASTVTATTCGSANGRISVVTVEGGSAPYLYSIDGGSFQGSTVFTSLLAGTHSITVKDANGCTYTDEVEVTNITGPSDLTASANTATCGNSNGRIYISQVTGGTAPYVYSVDGTNFQASTSITGLAAGEHQVTVKDANGCMFVKAVTVANASGPEGLTVTSQASTCGASNGQVRVSAVIGGEAPYSYSKDGINFQAETTLTGLASGLHVITVKDANGCTFTKQVKVENINGPSSYEAATVATTCGVANGSIIVSNVSGGTAPYTYALNGGEFQVSVAFAGVAAGEHKVVVKDANGCIYEKEVVVKNTPGPTGITADATSSTCGASNGALTVTAASGGVAPYLYSLDGVNFQESLVFGNLPAGSHTITVRDANGCTFSKAFAVYDIAGPTAALATAQPASCQDNDGSIVVGNVTGGTAPYTYSIDDTDFQSGTSFTDLVSGVYTLTVKDANGCAVTTSVSVGQNVPTGFASTSVASTCGRADGQLTIGAVTGGTAPYIYSIDGTSFQPLATFTALAAGAYNITVKDAKGCTYTGQVQVVDAFGPTGLSASVKGATCGSSNGEIIIASVAEGKGPYTYSLNGAAFKTSATNTNLAAGEYELRVKDANGCIYAETVHVPNAAGPADFAVALQNATCGGSNGSVTISAVTGGATPYTYSTDGTNFKASAILTGLAAGQHTVTVKDANGCTFAKAVVVAGVAGPTGVELSATPSICGKSDGSITVGKVVDGTAPYAYAIDGTRFQSETTFAAVSAGEHTITVKDANGCTIAKKIVVQDKAGPSGFTAAATPASCAADEGTITVSAIRGGTAPYTYSLDGISFQAASVFTGLAAGEYTVYVKDANGCSATAAVTVNMNAPQAAVLSAAPAGCGQRNGSITVTSVTGSTRPLAYSLDGATFQTSTKFEGLAAGSYTVTIRDSEGCTLTISQNVVNAGGVTSYKISETNTSCGKENGKISVSQVSGGQSPYTYSIDGITFQASPEFTGLAGGDYHVSVRDAKGCINTQAATIGNSDPLTDLSATVAAPVCGQPSGQISIDKVVGGTAPYTYSLDGTNFTTSTTLANIAPGNYTLTVKDAAGCTYSTKVQVEEGVSSSLDYVQNLDCSGGNTGVIAFKATGANSQTQYSIDNGKTFQKEAVFRNLAAGTYQLITKFSATCTIKVGTVEVKASDAMQITVTPLAKTAAEEKTGSAVVSVTGGVGPYAYQLDGGQFVADSVLTKLGAGNHTVLVKDRNGCTASVSFVIESESASAEINPEVEIPNGFTPNGDGINDRWVLKNLARFYPDCKVTVYNRWGTPVFFSAGYANAWDGTFEGKKLPDGTYYCVIELGNSIPPLKKSVTIMR